MIQVNLWAKDGSGEEAEHLRKVKESGNLNTVESLHPDLNHPQPICPHRDYVPYRHGPEYRWYPDGTMELK